LKGEKMPPILKIAAVQFDPKITENQKNLERMLKELEMAAGNGAKLVVYPECALTGYLFDSMAEAIPYTETIPGPSTEKFIAACKELGVYAVVGMLEKDRNKYYNAAIFTGPEGLIGKYRKIHLPYLGIDRFVNHGDKPYQVYKTPIGNVGLFICYDTNFPETARIMALEGADVLALPTNWPIERDKAAKYVIVTRAFENRVHFVACDRVGKERGATFLGLSKIINCTGDTLAEGSTDREETIYAEVDVAEARNKKVIIKKDELEIDCLSDRWPEFYGEIVKPRVGNPRH
jgi:5-aminopentanamidase